MGFSVSGATAVILVGGLIAFSFAFGAMNNGYERIAEAQEDRQERLLEQANADIEVVNASYDTNASSLTVETNNTGSAELVVSDVSLLVDGQYQPSANTSVDGDAGTDVWLAGEQLEHSLDAASKPDRVKVVTGTGTESTHTEVNTSG